MTARRVASLVVSYPSPKNRPRPISDPNALVLGLDKDETLKLRRYLLSLSLVAGRFQSPYNLRQGCLLVPVTGPAPVAQVVLPSGQRQAFAWEFGPSCEFAEAAAKDFGVWSKDAVAVDFAFQPEKVKAARQAMAKKMAEQKAAKKAKKKSAA